LRFNLQIDKLEAASSYDKPLTVSDDRHHGNAVASASVSQTASFGNITAS